MTISSIYSHQIDAAGRSAEISAPDAYERPIGMPAAVESLQSVTDLARLSDIAPRIHAGLSEMLKPGANVLDALSANIDRLQEGFVDALYTVFAEENIDLNYKMTLRLDKDTMLRVAGEHPEKERAEAALDKNPAISAAFGEIASQSEVLRDIANIHTVMRRQTGTAVYAATPSAPSSLMRYQMSLKGEMNHFYFSRS